MSQTTKNEVLEKLRGRYRTAGAVYRKKLIDQAVEVMAITANRPFGHWEANG